MLQLDLWWLSSQAYPAPTTGSWWGIALLAALGVLFGHVVMYGRAAKLDE